MRRIKMVLAALGVMAAITAAAAVPALADTNDHVFRNNDGDRLFFDNNDRNGFVLVNGGFNSPFGFGFPGFDGLNVFDNVNGFDGIHNGFFDGDQNFVIQRVG